MFPLLLELFIWGFVFLNALCIHSFLSFPKATAGVQVSPRDFPPPPPPHQSPGSCPGPPDIRALPDRQSNVSPQQDSSRLGPMHLGGILLPEDKS